MEFRFRAKHPETGTWMYFGIQNVPSWVQKEKVQQYTGLEDTDGTPIFDGDILTDHGDEGPLYIEYSKEHAAFVFVDKFDSFGTTFYTTTDISYEGFEVIGNIYEHRHLLEGEPIEAN